MQIKPIRSFRSHGMGNTALKILVISSLALVSLLTPSAQAEERPLTFAEAESKVTSGDTPYYGLVFKESFIAPQPSALYRSVDSGSLSNLLICESVLDSSCDGADLYLTTRFDPCTATSQLSCLGNFWAVDSSGKRIEGNLIRTVPFVATQAFDENVPLNIPASRSYGTIWQLPGVKNSAGTENYFVISQVTMFKNRTESKFSYGEINNSIIPIEELRGDYVVPVLDGKGGMAASGLTAAPGGRECLALEVGICQAPAQFPSGYRFGMNLHIGEKLNGWFHGRLSLPIVAIKDWNNGQELSIEGEPVKVPSLDFVVPKDQMSAEQLSLYNVCVSGNCGVRSSKGFISQTGGNLANPSSLNLITKFVDLYKDRATYTTTNWAFKNMFNHAGAIDTGKIGICSKQVNALNGLVLTNALGYSSGPPSFESGSGSLVYQVAAPHFEENGEVASGTYDLTINMEVARCLYNFSNAPIRAEVSITSAEGENRVATTAINEKDGWLYFSARGFTFSAPTIRVKFFQDKVSTTESTINKSESAKKPIQIAGKKSVTCTKGKTSKKVTGVKPKCPAGWKKK